VEIFEVFPTSSQSSVLQGPTVICVQKWYLKKIGTYTRYGSFWALLMT